MISVVMPAYNVEKYISKAIDSVIAQSYTDWELIIVDDCSTDNTVSIIESYVEKYSNIRLIKREINSGGCRLPRFDGILAAKGEFVCPIDSDDFIGGDYLQKCILRQKETQADIVLGRMVFCDEQGSLLKNRSIPIVNYNMNIVLSGYEICKKTIGAWEIAMAGLLGRTDLYKKYIRKFYTSNCNFAVVDEVDHRRFLYTADKVAMVDAHYFYRQQPNSLLHKVTPKYYFSIEASKLLYCWVLDNYKNEDAIIHEVGNEYVGRLYRLYCVYFTNKSEYSKDEKKKIKNILNSSFCFIKQNKIIPTEKKYIYFSKSKIIMIIFAFLSNLYGKFRQKI